MIHYPPKDAEIALYVIKHDSDNAYVGIEAIYTNKSQAENDLRKLREREPDVCFWLWATRTIPHER